MGNSAFQKSTIATPVSVANGGTGVTSSTGTGSTVLSNSPTLVTPALGTPASGVMTNVTGTATGLTSGITNALKSATTTVDVSAATAPSSGQVLTATSSTAAIWQTPAGGGENFRNVVLWGSANDGMLTSIGTGGSVSRVPAHTIINGGTGGNTSLLYGDLSTSNAFTNDWDNTMELHFTAIVIGTTNACHMAGFWKSGDSLPESSTWVNQHALFFYEGTTLYASNGNGSTQTKTSLGTTITTGHDYAIKFRVDSGEVDFLVDGSVAATHTTNIPSGTADSTIRFGFRAFSNTSNQRFTIRNGYVIKVDAD